MLFWQIFSVVLLLLVCGLYVWNILSHNEVEDLKVRVRKFEAWKTRISAATSTFNTDLLEIMDTSFREHWKYERFFKENQEAITRWAERLSGLHGEDDNGKA